MIPDDRDEEDRDGPGDSDSTSRGAWPRIRRALVRSLLGLSVLVLLLYAGARMGLGMGLAVPMALERVVPEGWAAEVGHVQGSWLGRMEIAGVSLEGPGTTVSAGRLLVRYRVRPLLDRTVEIRELLVERPVVRVVASDTVEAADSAISDTRGAGGSMVASMLAGEPVSPWSVRIASARIVDGLAEIRSATGASRYDLSAFHFSGDAALAERGLAVRADTLRGEFVSALDVSPDSAFRSSGRLALAGALRGGELTLDTLLLSSDESDLTGGGRMAFTADAELLSDVDLQIHARPLDLRDLPFVLPAPLLEQPQVSASFAASGTPDSVQVTLDVERFGAGGRAEARAVLRPRATPSPAAGGQTPAREQSPASNEAPARGEVEEPLEAGPAVPALEGSARFEDLALMGWSESPFDGTVSGNVTFTLGRLGAGASYTVDGSVTHRPTAVDPSRIVARPLRADFEASGRLPGDSARVEPLRADATVELHAGPAWTSLGSGTARVLGSTAAWTVDLVLDSGRVEGSGRVGWGEELVAEIDGLRTRRLDLSAIDTVYPRSRITGDASGRVRGADLEAMEGDVTVRLAPSLLQDLQVDTLALTSAIQGRTYRGGLFARTSMGQARTRYAVEVGDTLLGFEADSLEYALRDSVEGAPPRGELIGRASGTWALSEVRRATLEASVDSARWSTTTVSRGRIVGELEGDRIVAAVDLDAERTVPGSLGVEAHADVRGRTLPELAGSARLALRRTHPEGEGMTDSVLVRVQADDPGRFELDGSAHAGEGGELAFTGSAAAFIDSLAFDVEAQGGFGQPLALLAGATVDSVSVRAAGRRVSTVWQDMDGEIALEGARWRQLEAPRAMASVRYDSTGMHLDTLRLQSNVVEATGGGSLPAGGSGGRLEVRGRVLDLEPLREMMGLEALAAGGGTFQATASGSLDSLSWSTDASVDAVVMNQMRMTGLGLEGEGTLAAPHDFLFGLSSVDMELVLDRILLPESEIRSVRTNLAGGPDSLRVEMDASVDDRRSASGLIHVDPRPDRRRARIDDLRFQVDDDEWRLVEDAMVEYASGISVEPVVLRAGQQEIRFEGGVSAGVLDLHARMDSTDIGTVADLAGFPRLRGWANGRIRVQGPTDAPEAWLDATGAFHRAGLPPGPMEVTVRANGRRARGSLRLRNATSGLLEISGGLLFPDASSEETASASSGRTVPDSTIFGLATDSIDVTVDARDFDLRWTEAFFTSEQLASLSGIIQGSLTLRGSSAAPVLEGGLALRNGSARPTALGVRWDAVALSVRGDGSDLVVDTARISTSSGRLSADGTVGVTGALPLDLSVSMNDFQAIRTDAYRGVVSGDLDVGGVVTAPDIQGSLRVEALDIFLDERVTSQGLEPVELTEADLEMLRERFGVVPDTAATRRPIAERVTADLEVFLGRDSWLRKRTSPEMAVPFSGTIEVVLRPDEPPRLQGSVEVIEGRGFVEQFGRRFELSEGTVTFNGPPEETSVDLTATYRIPSHDNPDGAEVTIILEVTGTQSDLGLTLSSEPPLENADIVSYIATGRPAAGSLSFQGEGSNGGLVSTGAGFALSQMTSAIEAAAARSVGLDVVEIRREGFRQATLVAGKYVSPRLYVGFAQPISLQDGDGRSFGNETQSKLEIEYEALRWLILNLEGSGSSIRFFLRGRRAY